MAKTDLTVEFVRSLFHYDPETGVLRWKCDAPRWKRAGQVAGHADGKGYTRVLLLGKYVFTHRIAFAIHHERWPEHGVDHINGDRLDNRAVNLRDATARVNNQNRRNSRRAEEGRLLGVYKIARLKVNPWAAQIKDRGEVLYLGVYPTMQDAHDAYLAAKRRLHEGNTL